MTARSLKTMLARSVLACLAAISLIACGSREPATDAERLARGRELVDQMSARLAAAAAVSATTTETRDIVRFSGKKETISQTAVYTVRRPDRFYSKMTGGRGLETWYNGKILTIAAHPDKVFAQAPMPETIDRTLDAIAERYDMALPMGISFTVPPQRRCSPTPPPAATLARRTSATRLPSTSLSKIPASTGTSGFRNRATLCLCA